MILEICANSYQSAINAEHAGADRIELCSELAVGGITPSYGTIRKVVQALSIPVFVLIRPRSGNFTYSKEELAIMREDIRLCKELGCRGVVAGVLQGNGNIDLEQTQVLIEEAGDLEFTFHRAFDWVVNPREALQQLIDLGAGRILSSGQEVTAEKGLPLLTQLKEEAGGQIKLLPGGGIGPGNAAAFLKAGFSEVHASLTELEELNPAPRIAMNSLKHFSETHLATSSYEKIKRMLKKLHHEK